MLEKKVLIRVPIIEENYLLRKIFLTNICFEDYHTENEEIKLVILESDYNKLIKYDYKGVITFDKYVGIYNMIYIIKNNVEKLLVSILIIIMLFISNCFIYKVNIISSDINLKKNLLYSLEEYEIKPFTIKKNFRTIENIKSKIKAKYKNDIEWTEIEEKGNMYNIYVIKRKLQNKIPKPEKCNYVANKSGTISNIIVSKGVLLVQENNYVFKGDILISGDIIYNEELKNQVCASGKINGEVWYKVNVSYPLYISKIKNINSKYNISLSLFGNKHFVFNNKYSKTIKQTSIGNNRFGFSIEKSVKQKRTRKKISYDEALDKALNIAKEKVLKKTNNRGKILGENVLKKDIKNDKIIVEVLVTVDEELGIVENL